MFYNDIYIAREIIKHSLDGASLSHWKVVRLIDRESNEMAMKNTRKLENFYRIAENIRDHGFSLQFLGGLDLLVPPLTESRVTMETFFSGRVRVPIIDLGDLFSESCKRKSLRMVSFYRSRSKKLSAEYFNLVEKNQDLTVTINGHDLPPCYCFWDVYLISQVLRSTVASKRFKIKYLSWALWKSGLGSFLVKYAVVPAFIDLSVIALSVKLSSENTKFIWSFIPEIITKNLPWYAYFPLYWTLRVFSFKTTSKLMFKTKRWLGSFFT